MRTFPEFSSRRAAFLAGVLLTAGASLEGQNRVTVRGVAFDSLHGRPLAGAFVTAVGTQLSAFTDSLGRFSFENVAAGEYRFAAQHDVIDALGMSAIGARTNVTDGREMVRLFVPSFNQMWKVVCGPTPPPSDTGFVFGNIARTKNMKTVHGTVVSASWLDLVAEGKSVKQKLKTLETNVDSTGSFTLCGVPTFTGLSIRAIAEKDSAESGLFAIDPMGTERIVRRDLRLGSTLASVVAEKRGGTLVGMVVADSGGGVLSNAEVELEELGLKATTSDSGTFTISDILPGTHTLRVRRIGYGEAITRVDLEETQRVERTVAMNKATVLDSVAVKAAAIPKTEALRSFEEHQRLGLGKFLTRADLQKAGQRPLSSLLMQFNGLEVRKQMDGKYILYARRGTKSLQGSQICAVTVYLDGVIYSPGVPPDINEFLPDQLEGIEYFSGAGRIPPEYNKVGSACGVIVLHTRKGPG